MPTGWKEVRLWRARADEIRQAAEDMAIPSAKEGLEQAARNYELMADDLAHRLKEQGIEEPTAC